MERKRQITDEVAIGFLTTIINNTKISKKVRDEAQTMLEHRSLKAIQDIQEQDAKNVEAARMRMASLQEQEEKRTRIQRICSHKKKNIITGAIQPHTRGQTMQDGVLMILCQHCGKYFSDPPRPDLGWDKIPVDLYPDPSEIGGVHDPMQGLIAARMRYAPKELPEISDQETESPDDLELEPEEVLE